MRERKQIMEDRADAFITLPGGIGTLEEFFEAWTSGYLGMHDKPVVLLDPGGHFDGLLTWLSGLVDSGYVSQAAMDRLVVVNHIAPANATANRYAAVLAARGVGRGDVVGVMLRNSPNAVLMMLAVVKCGAIAGMLNYHQRGEVLAHSLGLLDAKVLVAEADLLDPVRE